MPEHKPFGTLFFRKKRTLPPQITPAQKERSRRPTTPAPAMSATAIRSHPRPRRIKQQRQLRQRQGPQQQPQIPQRNIKIRPIQQQIHDNPQQPRRHHVAENLRLQRDPDPRHDLDHPHHQHERVRVGPQRVAQLRRRILIPIHQLVRELVRPRQDRRHHESQLQNPIRHVRRPRVRPRFRIAHRNTNRRHNAPPS